MNIGHALNWEWTRINRSEEARCALRRWAGQEGALAALRDLGELWRLGACDFDEMTVMQTRSQVTRDGIVK